MTAHDHGGPPRPATMFLALEPDEALAATVLAYKHCVRALVGEQRYLADPPHLTLYLAVFAVPSQVLAAAAAVAAQRTAPCITVTGWHTFAADPLTGHHTLVCDIDRADAHGLRAFQQCVIDHVAPLRDSGGTTARLAGPFDQLSEERRRQVTSVGFPYVGADWHPHLTIASVRAEDWSRVAADLMPRPPAMVALCPTLKVYRLVDDLPCAVESFPLATSKVPA